MHKLLIALAGATLLMAFAPANASASEFSEPAAIVEAGQAPAFETAAASACQDDCTTVADMAQTGRGYAVKHRRGRSFANASCRLFANARDVQASSMRFASFRRRYASAARHTPDRAFA